MNREELVAQISRVRPCATVKTAGHLLNVSIRYRFRIVNLGFNSLLLCSVKERQFLFPVIFRICEPKVHQMPSNSRMSMITLRGSCM